MPTAFPSHRPDNREHAVYRKGGQNPLPIETAEKQNIPRETDCHPLSSPRREGARSISQRKSAPFPAAQFSCRRVAPDQSKSKTAPQAAAA